MSLLQLLLLIHLLWAGAITLSASTTFTGKRRSMVLGIIVGVVLTVIGFLIIGQSVGLIFGIGLYLIVACSIIKYQKSTEKMRGWQEEKIIIARRKGAVFFSMGGVLGFCWVLLLITGEGGGLLITPLLLAGYGAYKWSTALSQSAEMEDYNRMMYKRRLAGIIIVLGLIGGILTLTTFKSYILVETVYMPVVLGIGVIIFSVVYGAHRWHRAVHEERIHSVERKDRMKRETGKYVEHDEMTRKPNKAGMIIFAGITLGIFFIILGITTGLIDFFLSGLVISILSVVYGSYILHKSVPQAQRDSVHRGNRIQTITKEAHRDGEEIKEICPKCGRKIRRAVRYCPKCGEKIGESEYGH